MRTELAGGTETSAIKYPILFPIQTPNLGYRLSFGFLNHEDGTDRW